jgi:hypothetical protein
MTSSLGIYIDDTMIKYAKVIKEKDSYKIDCFNIVFYDNLSVALEQIINETNSSKLSICTNISKEKYGYLELFAGLTKQDIKSTVEIEFEMDCNEKGFNKDSLEMRYLVIDDKENTEKLKAMYIASEKADISKKAQTLGKFHLKSMTPTSTSITNLVEVGESDNIAIVNIEDATTVTTILNGQIYRVDRVDIGMKDILNDINRIENSMSKSYEICKNITIYTQDMQNNQPEESEHLEDVMPTLYRIVTEVKNIINNSFGNITNVYLTGSGTVINNIDLYFQEYLLNVKCEILRPFFIEGGNLKTSIKDYIEVNSAIALAMDGLGTGIKELNYANTSSATSAVNPLNKIINMLSRPIGEGSKGKSSKFNLSFKGPLDPIEKLLVRATATSLIATVGFMGFSNLVTKQIKTKTEEVATTLSTTNTELAKMDTQLSTINTKTSSYTSMIDAINELNNPTSSSGTEKNTRVIDKDAIPNLLTKIMTKIPQKVVITSIENTESNKIVIEAESSQYEQLGFFKGLITTENILANVKSTSGTKDGSVIKVTIEGELP